MQPLEEKFTTVFGQIADLDDRIDNIDTRSPKFVSDYHKTESDNGQLDEEGKPKLSAK